MTDGPADRGWPAAYRCLHHQVFARGDYQLRPVAWADIEPIRQWRNGQLEVLRQVEPLDSSTQERYFDSVVRPQMDEERPEQVLVAFLRDGELIGYGGVVHINWANRRGEVSFLVEPARASGPSYVTEFSAFLELLDDLAVDLGLHRLTTETFEFRHETIAVLEGHGFVREGRLRQSQLDGDRYVDAFVHGLLLDQRATTSPAFSVLISSAAAKIPLLRAIEDAARRVSPRLDVVAGDADPGALSLRLADRPWTMPPTDDASLPELLAGLEDHGIAAVIPTRDGELAFFARHAELLESRGVTVMVSPPATVERCLDKLEFARFVAAAGLPTIPTASALDPAVVGDGPYVVKERFGAGSRSLGLDLAADEAMAWAAGLDEPVFQPFVTGPEISIDVFVAADGSWMGAIARSRDEVVGGESRVTTTILDDVATDLGRAAAEALGIRGHAVLQAIGGPDGYQLVECNARVGGASTLAYAAGLDSLYWFLLEVAGEDPADHPFHRAPRPMRLVRVPSDVVT